MIGATRAACAAWVLAGVLGVSGMSSTATAQVRRQPQGAQPAPPQPMQAAPRPLPQPTTGPRIGFAADPNQFQVPNRFQVPGQFPFPSQFQFPFRRHFQQPYAPAVIYYPVPMGYFYYPSGCGASVCDVNGNRVMRGFDEPEPYRQPQSPAAVPDLTGSPYVALDGGAIVADFGNGDRRTIASCAAEQSVMTPDGQPRTIFYSPPADGLILRQGARGNIMGTPASPGVRMCYGLDQYGRVTLLY